MAQLERRKAADLARQRAEAQAGNEARRRALEEHEAAQNAEIDERRREIAQKAADREEMMKAEQARLAREKHSRREAEQRKLQRAKKRHAAQLQQKRQEMNKKILAHEHRCQEIEEAKEAENEAHRRAQRQRQERARQARLRQEEEDRLEAEIVEAKEAEIEARLEQIRQAQEAQKMAIQEQLAAKNRRAEEKKKKHERTVSLQREMLEEMVKEKDGAIEEVARRKEAKRQERAERARQRAAKVERQRQRKLIRAEQARQETLMNLQAKQQRVASVKEQQKREARLRTKTQAEQLRQKHEVEQLMAKWQKGDKKAEAKILKIFRESGMGDPFESSSSSSSRPGTSFSSRGKRRKKARNVPRKAGEGTPSSKATSNRRERKNLSPRVARAAEASSPGRDRARPKLTRRRPKGKAKPKQAHDPHEGEDYWISDDEFAESVDNQTQKTSTAQTVDFVAPPPRAHTHHSSEASEKPNSQDMAYADYDYEAEIPPTSVGLKSRLAWSPRRRQGHSPSSQSSPRNPRGALLTPETGLATHRSAITEETALEYSDDELRDAVSGRRSASSTAKDSAAKARESEERILRRKHNEELLKVLEDEQMREADRLAKLESCNDAADRARLEAIFSEERTKSSERILALSMQHEKELEKLAANAAGSTV
eukprot:INCI7204.1.p1 GENE.INCI7204.1~~INCI7204.1.p1  ORF type:complete len:656 (+),score=186.49 INCI7204.1:1203-3170(+)